MARSAARLLPGGLVGAFSLVAAVAVVLGGAVWTRRAIPQLDGRTPVDGLRAAVDVHLDRLATPDLDAALESDGWTAVGDLQARDRLWQGHAAGHEQEAGEWPRT